MEATPQVPHSSRLFLVDHEEIPFASAMSSGGWVAGGNDEEALGIDAEFRRMLAGLRRLPRHQRASALRAARDMRAAAFKALREKRSRARHVRQMLNRVRTAQPR